MIIRSISGVRGLTDSHLTEELVCNYARALNKQLIPGVIILGRDSRPSGDDLITAFTNELMALGRDVIHCGIVPTPTIQFMVEKTEAVGGVVVTASHNPVEWNGLKFVRSDGTFFHPSECEQLFDLVDKKIPKENVDNPGLFFSDKNAVLKHSLHILSLSCIDLNVIRKRQFKVVIDAVNGAGAEALPTLLEQLGCEVIRLNCETSGEFTRGTEPLPEHLSDLCETVIKQGADVGFAVDPDADRLAIVSEKGDPLGEEYTLVLAAVGYLKSGRKNETFVTNLSTSLALDKLASAFGCSVSRSAVGEINVVKKMLSIGAEFGGEGNGGVILKEAHLGRDSLVGAVMVLNTMVQDKRPISEIHFALPQFIIMKDKVVLEELEMNKVMKKIQNIFPDANINTLDGVKFSWDDKWVHIRQSNTEPIIRIYAEANTREKAQDLIDHVKKNIHI